MTQCRFKGRCRLAKKCDERDEDAYGYCGEWKRIFWDKKYQEGHRK